MEKLYQTVDRQCQRPSSWMHWCFPLEQQFQNSWQLEPRVFLAGGQEDSSLQLCVCGQIVWPGCSSSSHEGFFFFFDGGRELPSGPLFNRRRQHSSLQLWNPSEQSASGFINYLREHLQTFVKSFPIFQTFRKCFTFAFARGSDGQGNTHLLTQPS